MAFLIAGLLIAGIGAGTFFYLQWTADRAAEATAAATAQAFAQGQAAAKAQADAQSKAAAEAAAEADAAEATHPAIGTGTQPPTGSSTSFDPGTATRVPAGQTPKAYVAEYYQAILDKKWQKAFDMQPYTAKQGTVASFQQTQEEMYGMTAFSIYSEVTGTTEATVVARQDLGTNGIWNTTWGFVDDGAGTWLVKTRTVALGEPVK